MDEVDEWAVRMTATVNGEAWASGSTKDRTFSFAEVLAWASLDEPVYPGEFFAIGTVGGGCGLELDRWIQPGDVVELAASGVGVLRNPVGERRVSPGGLATYQGAPEVHLRSQEEKCFPVSPPMSRSKKATTGSPNAAKPGWSPTEPGAGATPD